MNVFVTLQINEPAPNIAKKDKTINPHFSFVGYDLIFEYGRIRKEKDSVEHIAVTCIAELKLFLVILTIFL